MAPRYGGTDGELGITTGPPGFSWRVLAVALFTACLVAYLWLWLADGKAIGSGLLLVPVLLLLTAPALARASRNETTFDLAGLMAAGLALRFIGAYFRFVGGVDAHVYNDAGTKLAESFRALRFDVDTGRPIPGTGGLRYLTGLVSVPFGADEFAKFLVFAWLGFLGCVLLYRAFVTAVPEGDRYRYARLIFLWPSLVFWPSSIGKESWMLFTLGIAMLGAAKVLVRQRGGYTLLVIGLFGGTLVRPHVMLLVAVAFAIGLLVRRRQPAREDLLTPAGVGKAAGLVIVLLVGGVLATHTERLLELGDLKTSSVDSALETTRERTAQGGSEYEPSDGQKPDGYVTAMVTILFRPFPQEADGFEQVVAAAEGLFLAGLFLFSWRRLVALPGRLLREPHVVVALAFLLMVVYAFASIGNFGILARQRTQVLPFVFVLLAVPAVARAGRERATQHHPRAVLT